jgi:hypothetical protein
MLSFAALSSVPLSSARDEEGLPFGAFAQIGVSASGTPSLLRVSSSFAVVSASATATMRVVVFASMSALVSIAAAGTPNFTLYAATREFISRSADQVANQPFYGTLQQTVQFDQSIITGNGFGQVTIAWGEITLINSDGAYDEVIGRYAADGRRLVLKVGDERRIKETGYDGFYTVFDGIATGIHVEEGVMRVYLRDRTYQLEAPVSASIYGGTGGLDGTEDNKGKRKPRAFGYCANVTPAFISPTLKMFQVDEGPVKAISAVYSRGNAVAFDQNYSTAAALMAATIPSGKYATCILNGLFRVNFVLEGEITADVEGNSTGGFISTSADIVKRLLAGFELEIASFAAVNALQPAPIGYFVETGSDATIADVIADIMGAIGGYGGFQRDGVKFEVGLFRAPASVPSASYSRIDIIEIKREQLPQGISPPPYRYRVAWGRNFTQQTDIASAVSSARVAFLAEQYRLSEASDANIKIDHPLAQDPQVVEAYFRDQADATTEAARLLELYGLSSFSLYRIVLKSKPFVHRIGEVVWVTYPRWDLIEGRLLRIVSVSEKIEANEVEIVGFG